MSSSEHGELMDLIDRAFCELGGRAVKAEVSMHVEQMMPQHLARYLIGQGLSTKIGQYFRSVGDEGLPQAPEIDAAGTHAQLELLDEHEYRYVIAQQMKASENARARAQQYADMCEERLGVRIDIDAPLAEERAA